MGSILYKDERTKLGVFIVLVFIIQGFLFYGANKMILNNVNKAYITQNSEVVGTIAEKNKVLAKEIVPILTGKQEGNYNLGKSIMGNYAYNSKLPYIENPLFKNIEGFKNLLVILASLTGLIIMLSGTYCILKPFFKEIKYLTKRAEDIVENRYTEERRFGTGHGGSLDRLFNKFNLMEDRIKNNIELLKEEKVNLKNIINDISHQLKTPVTALTMYNDILQEHREMNDEDMDIFIDSSKEQLDRMEWLVLTLLKYARLESNVVRYDKEKMPLKNTIEEAIEPLKIKAKEKNQTLEFIYDTEGIFYHDKQWLAEAISNIVKNAIEHTDIKGNVEVSLEESEIAIIIRIKDNGEGIEESEIKKIFQRFYKGESSTNPTSIGIGLCLSKAIVNAHSGDITVESVVGKGTVFYIKLLKTI